MRKRPCTFINREGQRFGRLVVIAEDGRTKQGRITWLCRCDCGQETTVAINNLTSGHTKSCGCYMRDRIKEASRTHGHFMNGQQTRLYAIWAGMKKRCQNPNVKGFKYYGARGIQVCDEWQAFEPFCDWALANGYSNDLTIDRIESDGNYEPVNCRWITFEENARRSGLKQAEKRRREIQETTGKPVKVA